MALDMPASPKKKVEASQSAIARIFAYSFSKRGCPILMELFLICGVGFSGLAGSPRTF